MLTKTEPKVSVIIPVYNVEKYLPKCLDSLINQTFVDIEIICIDDGSTDNCLQILNEYAQKDDRIIVITQENQGPGVARNKGLEIAKGEYLSFIDPDDWVSLNFYESLYSEATVGNYDLVKSCFVHVTNNILKHEKIKVSHFKNLKNKYNRIDILTKELGYYWQSCIYKSEIIKKYNLTFPPTYWKEDMVFYNSFLLLTNTCSICKNSYYYYAIRNDSLVPNAKKSLILKIQAFEARLFMFNLINQWNLSKADYKVAVIFVMGGLLYSISELINDGFEENLLQIYSYIDNFINNIKYREEFINMENYKILCIKNYGKDLRIRTINTKFKNLKIFQKLFYIGNFHHYKLLSILGLRFVFKRF